MLRNIALACIASFALLAVGCGGGDDTSATGGGADMAAAVYKVVSGTYTVKNVTKTSDACGIMFETTLTSLQVTNNGSGHLSLGSQCMSTGNPPTCTPAVYQLGEGDFTSNYNVTTTATTMVTADNTATPCTYTRTRTGVVTVTAPNTLHIDFTEDESNIAMTACGFNMATCQSKYTFDASM